MDLSRGRRQLAMSKWLAGAAVVLASICTISVDEHAQGATTFNCSLIPSKAVNAALVTGVSNPESESWSASAGGYGTECIYQLLHEGPLDSVIIKDDLHFTRGSFSAWISKVHGRQIPYKGIEVYLLPQERSIVPGVPKLLSIIAFKDGVTYEVSSPIGSSGREIALMGKVLAGVEGGKA